MVTYLPEPLGTGERPRGAGGRIFPARLPSRLPLLPPARLWAWEREEGEGGWGLGIPSQSHSPCCRDKFHHPELPKKLAPPTARDLGKVVTGSLQCNSPHSC